MNCSISPVPLETSYKAVLYKSPFSRATSLHSVRACLLIMQSLCLSRRRKVGSAFTQCRALTTLDLSILQRKAQLGQTTHLRQSLVHSASFRRKGPRRVLSGPLIPTYFITSNK